MGHVLIIEDEPLIALNLQWLLEQSGATSVAIAESEADAVCCAKAHRPTFITTDLSLKTGTGASALHAIFEACGEIPAIYVTSNPEACVGLAPQHCVFRKPIDETLVAEAFRAMTKG